MITIGEEILLLMLDYDAGRMNRKLPVYALGNAISGALLMDLAFGNRIDTDPEALFVVNPAPLGEPVQDSVLARIAADGEQRTTDHWVQLFADDYETLQPQLLDCLVARGILLRGPYDRLWVRGAHRYVTEDGRPLRDVRQRIAGVLLSDEIPDSRDIMIISLADACALWHGLTDKVGLAQLEPKIKQVAKMDLIGQAVARAMNETGN